MGLPYYPLSLHGRKEGTDIEAGSQIWVSRKLLSLKTSDSIWCPSTQAGFWLPWGPCLNHGQEGVQSSSIMCGSLTPRSSYRVTQRKQSKWNVGSTFYNTRNRTTMDEEGYIWFPGRSHDTINASGMNITNQMDNTSAGEEVEKSEKSEPVGMSNGAATFLEDSMRVS
ncbi:PREDICTED: uncharacterized protein LOC105591268 isoform X3 [Cercocebus atys]|uniref:uncharacterized protein LOC105591268 isoform X3 n=1 Tax=Cercocebus atys TaxID=9531 RepID=UPI0005F48A92|nr:PREDICTED: uncharacterized protein LOC105591268 isoform X3 [Cercocebus atys]